MAASVQFDVASSVTAVVVREQRGREEWRAALTAMRVFRKGPTFSSPPPGLTHGVRIVAQRKHGAMNIDSFKGCDRIKSPCPEIIHPDDLESCHDNHFIAQNLNSCFSKCCRHSIRRSFIGPAPSIFMV